MTAADVNATFFNPIADVLWLLIIAVIGFVLALVQADRKCRNFVRVVIVRADGSTDTEYAPKHGGSVSLTKPGSNTTRTWPISRLASIEKLYPGGFLPSWMQRKIREVIVDEDDWEPLLNRSPFSKRVASPDVITAIRAFAASHGDCAELITLADSLSKAPTRLMIASPAVFGNLMMEKVTETLITVNKEMLDKVSNLMHKLDNVVSSTKLYVCTGIVVIGVGVLIYFTIQTNNSVQQNTADINLIENALGIVKVAVNATPVK